MKAELPSELRCLVHHIELNRAGWWERSVERLLLATLWVSDLESSAAQLRSSLSADYGVRLSEDFIAERLAKLRGAGLIVEPRNGVYKLAQQARTQLGSTVDQAEALEGEVARRFEACLSDCSVPGGTLSWSTFTETFLVPLVRELGARTYEVISGRSADASKIPTLADFLAAYDEGVRSCLRAAIESFLDPKDEAVRSYVLEYLNAYFLLEAANLDAAQVKRLTVEGRRPSFHVFVDTNFLFSILELHDNPSNDAAEALMSTVEAVKDSLEIKIYVSRATLDEMRRTLSAYEFSLAEMRPRPNLVRGLAEAQLALSGIGERFFQRVAETGVSAADYFKPYLESPLPVLRARGIELHNADLGKYRTDQRVIDDIADQMKFEEERVARQPPRPGREPRKKSYEILEHDVIMWHFIRDSRPDHTMVLEARDWITTIDFRFLGFDRFKRRAGAELPVCVHPTALVQMLQLWVPRTPELEEAALRTLRPILAGQFDPSTEQVTLQILRALSRFEDVGDIPPSAVASLLVDGALRRRIEREREVEKQIELVKEALVNELSSSHKELEESRRRESDLQLKVAAAEERAVELEKQRSTTVSDASTRADEMDRRVDTLEGELAKEREDLAQERQKRAVYGALLRLGAVAASLAITLGVVVAYVSVIWAWPFGLTRKAATVNSAGALLVWVAALDLCSGGLDALQSHPLRAVLSRMRTWIYATIGVLFLGLLGEAVYRWLTS